MNDLEMLVDIVSSSEGGGTFLIGTLHDICWQVMQLDVLDDKCRLDILFTFWTL